MATAVNHQLRLKERPTGEAQESDFALTEETVPSAGAGQVVVQAHYISIDPSLRTHLNAGKSYRSVVQIGDVIDVPVGGEVIASENPDFAVGDFVTGSLGIQEFAVSNGSNLTKADLSLAPLTSWLGGLGLTGLTAYFGLLEIGDPKPGETVVVTAAAGAVGMIVGQIARIKGARAIGTAGGPVKCAFLTDELGFDGAADYKSDDFYRQLREHTPDRIDVIFDNVGGPLLDTVMRRLGMSGRIVVSGATSQYNKDVIHGPSNYLALATMRAKMEGFIIFDFAGRYAEARREMAGWIREGKLKLKENVVDGEIADYPRVLHRLYEGENVGKMLMRLPSAR